MATLYLRGTTWWAWGYDREGRRWQRSTKQTEERSAKTVAAKIEQELALDAHHAKDTKYTLGEALELTIDHAEGLGRRPKSVEFLTSKSRHVQRLLGENLECSRIKLADTTRYVAERLREGAHRHTVHKEVRVLLQSLRLALKLGKYRGPDVGTLRPDGLENAYEPRERWLTPDDYRQVLWQLLPDNDGRRKFDRRDYVIVACGTGVRLGELYKLEAHHCDFVGKLLHVPGTKTRKARRVIPMTPAVAEVLARRCAEHETGALFPVWHTIQRDLDAACLRIEKTLNPDWEPAGDTRYVDAHRKQPAKKGRERPPVRFDTISANDLRRTFASWLAQAGVPLFHAADLMGHEDTKMLQRVYARLAPENLRNAVAKLPASVAQIQSKPKPTKRPEPTLSN
ncbi:MAG TPA: site-specific integrase [Polyangiaceae bacterium]|nr:site-specific integrase [Polyangiaceae bacterium]